MPMEHGEQHRQAILLKPYCHSAGIAQGAVINQRLNLNEQWPGAFHTTTTVVPGAICSERSKKIADGLVTSRMPASVIAKMPSSFTAQIGFSDP